MAGSASLEASWAGGRAPRVWGDSPHTPHRPDHNSAAAHVAMAAADPAGVRRECLSPYTSRGELLFGVRSDTKKIIIRMFNQRGAKGSATNLCRSERRRLNRGDEARRPD